MWGRTYRQVRGALPALLLCSASVVVVERLIDGVYGWLVGEELPTGSLPLTLLRLWPLLGLKGVLVAPLVGVLYVAAQEALRGRPVTLHLARGALQRHGLRQIRFFAALHGLLGASGLVGLALALVPWVGEAVWVCGLLPSLTLSAFYGALLVVVLEVEPVFALRQMWRLAVRFTAEALGLSINLLVVLVLPVWVATWLGRPWLAVLWVWFWLALAVPYTVLRYHTNVAPFLPDGRFHKTTPWD